MASITRLRLGCLLPNFSNLLIKQSSILNKNQKSLFHCSLFLNGAGIEIKMPSLSPTMVEGKIVKWLKKEGDPINPGDAICDIETDKAVVTMEIEDEGILAKILVPENSSSIKIGSLIALMVSEGENWKDVGIPAGTENSDSSSGSSESKNVIKGPPTIPIKMPSLSPTMTVGTIVKWLKKEGDIISPGDALCEIQTDKSVITLETEEEGILAKIILPTDSKDVEVGTLIGLIVAEGADWKNVTVELSDVPKDKKVSQSQSHPSSGASDLRGKSFGPAVKSLLAIYQLEPGLIKPSGRNNRLLKEDVTKYIEDNKLEKKPQKVVSGPSVASKSPAQPPAPIHPVSQTKVGSDYTDIEISNIRQVIARRLTQSKTEIPHSYANVKCDLTEMKKAKTVIEKHGKKVSFNDLIVKSTSLALQMYPKANAVCIKNEVKLMKDVDISVAVATKSGLITPIVKSANLKSVLEISQEIKDLAERGRAGKLKPEEFMGGSFSISNLGMYGVTHFKAIINPPQCGILAVGVNTQNVQPDLSVREQITLSLSFDRRALEEHEAARFMETLKYFIENPTLIAVNRESSVMSM